MNTLRNLRKKIAGFSVAMIIAGLFSTGLVSAQSTNTGNIFSDVPADAWYADYVNQLADAGVIDTTQDKYRPSDLVNRAEMAKFVVLGAEIPVQTATSAPFSDVAMGMWYTNYVHTAKQEGIVSGKKDANGNLTGKYEPAAPVTRGEAAKMIVNAFAFAEDTSGAPHFPDVNTSYWGYAFVETAFNNGIVSGYPDGNFKPNNNINRAEMAKIIALARSGISHEFTLESASAASATKVELIFSQDVEEASAEMASNYTITDSSGTALQVSAAEKVSADTVHLTTASQTAGRTYTVVAKNVKSAAGEDLANTDGASFMGYGSDVTGGALNVSLSTATPVAGSVPSGATGVVFTCWDFKAQQAAMIKSLHVHRVGPGSQNDFTNVYLYRGDQRLTTGRTINSETQMVEFNNINQNIAAGENAKMCLVADLANTSGGVHAFELGSAADVMTNSSDLQGSFPLRGADQLITSAQVGSVTVRRNGQLDELTVGQKDARIAQFELEANGQEDEMLQRIALYIRGSVTVSDLKNLRLFTEGQATALATASDVGQKDLATFALTTPYKIGRGQRKIFYVLADLSPTRNGDNVKVYLDETTDLLVKGVTYGYGVQVKMTAATGGSYDGTDGDTTPGNSSDRFSYSTIKGSAFNVSTTGPAAGDIAIGQQTAHCLDMTITNGSGSSVELKDWVVTLAELGAITNGGADGLINGTSTPNFTLIKLAKINDDGSLGGTLLGPSELVTSGSDSSQNITLNGSANLNAGESVKAAIVFNVASNTDASFNGDQIKCTLQNLATTADAVRDQNGDALDAASITPAANIPGNIMKISQAGLTIALNSTPSSTNISRGSVAAPLAGFSITSGSSLDNTLKSLTITGEIDGDGNGTFTAGQDGGVILSNVVYNGVALYDGTTKVSDVKNINATNGTITFTNLNILVPKGQTKNLVLKGDISTSAPFTGTSDVVRFKVASNNDVVAIDQNQQTVSSSAVSVTGAANDGTTAGGNVRMTIVGSGSGTVSSTASASSTAVAGATTIEAGKWTFTSVNENSTLKDLQFAVLNSDGSSISNVMLYSGSGCSTQIGTTGGYVPNPAGIVNVNDLNVTLSSSQTLTLCAKVQSSTVNSDGVSQPTSGSDIGLALINVTEVSSSAGENIAAKYAGTATGTAAAVVGTNGIAADDISLSYANGAANDIDVTGSTIGALQAGDVLIIDAEYILVTDASGTTPADVSRGFANTSAASHSAGAIVTRSTIATRTVLTAVDGALDGEFVPGDIYVLNSEPTQYCLITSVTADAAGGAAEDTYTVEPVLGSTIADCPANGSELVNNGVYTVFKLHGPLSKLYRSVPQISKATPSVSQLISSNSTMLDLNVKAIGDQVRFTAADTNQIKMRLSTSNAAGFGAATCELVNATGGNQLLDTVDLANLDNITTQDVIFTFATNSLTIDADQTVNLKANCNTQGLAKGGFNISISGSLQAVNDVVEWGDTINPDVTGAGKLIISSQLTGNTFGN